MPPLARTAGAYRVTLVHDGDFQASTDVLRHLGDPQGRDRILQAFPDGQFRIPVHCFLVEDGARKRLVDAGTGTAWGPAFGHAIGGLRALDVAPDAVDEVLLTHIHGDHAWGLIENGEAVFPRARVIVSETDLAFFTDPAERDRVPEARRAGWTIAGQMLAAYAGRIDAVPAGEVLPGVHLEPLPGHTPGHAGIRFSDAAQGDLLLWGDVVHLPVQAEDPDIALAFDLDLAAAARSRRDVLGRAARHGWRVAGGHVPGFSRVTAEGAAFRLVPDA